MEHRKPGGNLVCKSENSQNVERHNEAESGPVEFQVTKGTLVPVVKSIESKTYDGNTNATGILGLIGCRKEVRFPAGDRAAVNAEDAVSGTFSWTSSAAGTDTG